MEQRKHPRINLLLETTYYSGAPEGGGETQRECLPGTIVNSSRYGLGLQVRCPHEPLEQLWFEELELDNSPVTGLVQWIDSTQPGLYRVGIRLFHPAP